MMSFNEQKYFYFDMIKLISFPSMADGILGLILLKISPSSCGIHFKLFSELCNLSSIKKL